MKVLNREEMKMVMAGSMEDDLGGCTSECQYIGNRCFEEAGYDELMYFRVIHCCQAQCMGTVC